MVFALNDLIQGPYAGIYRHFGDHRQELRGILPASGAGAEHVDKGWAFCVDGAMGLFMKVLEIPQQGGLRRIRHPMGHHDPGQVLLVLLFAYGFNTGRRCCGAGETGRRGGPLGTGVHIGIIIIAEIGKVMAALQGAGQRLKTDIIGAAVSADGQDLEIPLLQALALPDGIGRGYAGGHCGSIFKSGMDVGILPGCIGILEGRDLQAGGSVADDCLVFGIHGTHHGPAGDPGTAARAEAVAGGEAFGFIQFLF